MLKLIAGVSAVVLGACVARRRTNNHASRLERTLTATGIGMSALLLGSLALARYMRLSPGPDRLSLGQHVFGHRGCRNITGIPENTLEAFSYAKAGGASGIELDVRVTRDNQLVVFHDAFLSPIMIVSEPKKEIGDFTLEELRAMHFRDDPKQTIQMPTLEEAILYCRHNQLKMLIEIKECQKAKVCVDGIAALFRKHSSYLSSEATVISFYPLSLYRLRALVPECAVCILWQSDYYSELVATKYDRYPAFVEYGTPFWDWAMAFFESRIAPTLMGASCMGPEYKLYTESLRQYWVSRGKLVYLWGFPSVKEHTPEMKAPGVLVGVDSEYARFK